MGRWMLGKASTQDLIRKIDDSHVPLAEEEQTLSSIKEKVRQGKTLTKEEDRFLRELMTKAREWQKAVQSSAATERDHTFAG